MESRLRKLLSPRRLKARRSDATAELDPQSIPYSTTPSQGRLPVLINQALRKSGAVKQRESRPPSDPLRSFSYEEAAAGKPPQLGHRPQRGNGPVKLQTSRRLSSGELLVTEQDYDRTLEEIREGEYIVGGKERRASKSSSQPKSPTEPTGLKFISTAPSSPREQVSFSGPMWQPASVLAEFAPVASPASASSIFHPPQRSYSAQAYYPDYRREGLGISSPAQQLYTRPVMSSTSLLEPHEEHNPTIQALWKAEYSRLVSMCGQTGADNSTAELDKHHGDAPIPHASSLMEHRRSYSYSSRSVSQPNYLPTSPARVGVSSRMNASTSVLDLAYHDDHHSEGSSHPRYSHLSSSGASSSLTTRTSIAEEPNTTRDDIRKIVDDMRTTYLQAIEAQTPPLLPVSSPSLDNPRSKTRTPSLMSYASVDSSLRSASRHSTTRTKSWQSSTNHLTTTRASATSPMMKSKRPGSSTSRRTSGQPAAGIATLTPIEASPAKSAKSSQNKKAHDGGLKRADSTTLGVMTRKLAIVDDRPSTGSSQPGSKQSPTFYNTSESDSDSSSSAASSPMKISSVQHTPEKHKTSGRQQSPLAKQPWQIDVDQILPDEDLDLALDIDEFETLCDGLFNSVSASTEGGSGSGGGGLGMFQTWDGSETPFPLQRRDTFDHGVFASTTPAELRTSKFAKELGLGLTGLPAMI